MAERTQDLLGQLEAKVSELQQAQEQYAQSQTRLLHWSEERLARVLETAHEAFVGMDSEGRIVDWNPRAETTFGWSREEILGRSLAETIIPDRYREAHHRGLSRFLGTGEGPVLNQRFEITALHRDGHEFPIELAIWPLRWKDGYLFHALLHDITDRKRAEEELRRSEESLRRTSAELEVQSQRAMEANRQKSEFLANMSHELRTPLNAIIGFSELIYESKAGPISANQKEYLADVLVSSRHLLQLINDVLDLAKVESGKIEFRPEPADLARIAGEVRDTLRTIAAQKQIRMNVFVDPSLEDVFADQSRLKQVLYNYVSNAIKFSHVGGVVSVRLLPEGTTEFRIEVEDSGIGIDPEHVNLLFAEFQQLDPGMSKKYSGTGLGLALTKRIVEAQKGRVGVRSTPGEGSVFFAVLPRVSIAEPNIDTTAAALPLA
jgi:PAS domain S-box-containing protein